MPFDPSKNRRQLFSDGFNQLLNQVAEATDIKKPLAFLGLDRSYTTMTREAMWTDFQILFGSYENSDAKRVASACLNEVNRQDGLLNIWQGDTELMRINREAHQHPVPVSDDLFDFIATAKRLYDQTGGAFDVSSTPLVRCWGFFTRNPRIPTQREIDEARAHVGMEHVQLDEEKRTVFFTREGLELTPASMGKGFAIDRAVAIARERGLQDVLLNGGFSSVYASGAPAWKDHWQIDVRNPLGSEKPLARLRLCNQGFSSSGSEDQKILADGHLFSHIIDPRTGWPAEEMLNINVVAPTATEAEALSTAFFVLGVEKTLEYCENHSEIGVVMLAAAQQPGGHPRVITANLDPSQVEVV